MPVLARFNGIVIRMVFTRTLAPHFHAMYQGAELVVGISPVRILNGSAPLRICSMVTEWADMHQQELQEAWRRMSLTPVRISSQR